MEDLTPALIAILRKYTSDDAIVAGSTPFSALEIDELDLPMVFLDVEDAFDVQIECDDAIEDVTTVATLAALVAARIAIKSAQPRRSSVPRSTRGWMAA